MTGDRGLTLVEQSAAGGRLTGDAQISLV